MGTLLTHATLATMEDGYGLRPDAALAMEMGKIVWIGATDAIPAAYAGYDSLHCEGRLVTPGLIDCHSHVVFAGDRAQEFEARLNGARYEDIARAGGGILSTVRATRAASEADLLAQSLPRVDMMAASGTTTVEIKSGYGLDIASEITMLRAARRIPGLRRMNVVTTHLAAHAIPPEYQGRADDYVDQVAIPSLHAAHSDGLIDAVDAFCETIAFTPAQVDRLFTAARHLDLPVKLHAEQLTNSEGAALAARHGALSADHLEHLSETGIAAMARSQTIAVILPGAYYTLRDTIPPPIARLRDAGIKMAIATDCNPGSSPMTSLPLAMNMACTLFRITPLEALLGTTIHAASALGLTDRGTLTIGKRSDICIWDANHPAELSYRIGATPLRHRIIGGVFDT
ncbi:MAG: imidazolonepropionase [Rhodobacteraceae bacterium]|jgi:imidazolonepropionase|nr:imidazolonepropionase [Paracoccaceae bacterium]